MLVDFVNRAKFYKSDIMDGLNLKTLAAVFFLYFACLAPAIAFGGLMANLTGNAMGATEMLLATAIVMIVYALLCAQPLLVLGGTGPLLVFSGVLYDLCVVC
jgi:HCO3- transporter integral membrane domain